MLLFWDVSRSQQGTEDSGIWGPRGTIGSDLLILINGFFSPAQPTSPELKSGHSDGLCWLPACSQWAHRGRALACVPPAKRLQSQRGEASESSSGWAGPRDQAGQFWAPCSPSTELPRAAESVLAGGGAQLWLPRCSRLLKEGLLRRTQPEL